MQGTVETQSIDDARQFCKGNASGADVISINNEEENAFILKSFHTRWHGPEYISLGMFFDTDDDTFKWYDDSSVNFTNWMEEEGYEGPVDICATMHTASGGWKKTGCEYLPLTAILCEKADSSATVLTIKDAEENSFVITHLKEHSFITGRVWLGLYTHAKSSNWLDDGSEVKYTNWAKGKASGECSIIFSTNGTWSQIDCLKDQSRVVCKAPQVSNHTGGAIAVAVFIILAFLAGLIYFLYKKKRLQWGGFSSVRYERGMHDDETDSMFTRDGD